MEMAFVSLLFIICIFMWWKATKECASTKENRSHLQYKIECLEKDKENLASEIILKESLYREQISTLKASSESMKHEFKAIAGDMIKSNADVISAENAKALSNVISPFDQELKNFKTRIELVHIEDTKQRSMLQNEITQLQKSNTDVNKVAGDLAMTLKGSSKQQGKWGELVLENVLSESGLRSGTDYKLEVSKTTAEGRKRPDAIVYMPEGKHIIIDAKTSLRAYMGLVNASTDEERDQFLKEHVSNVWDRLNELSERAYEEVEGFNSPDIVIMFMPIESAYIEMIKSDSQFFQAAMEKNIVVATPSTLLSTLHIVKQIWRHDAQSANAAKLAETAQKLAGKVSLYVESVEKLGNTLERARIDHEAISHHLTAGKGNLVKRIRDFEELGVKVQKKLPEGLVEKAMLEIG